MRAVVQRVLSAGVSIVERPEPALDNAAGADGAGTPTLREAAEIGPGFLVLVGIGKEDTDEDARNLADKIAHLRVLEDENGKLNLSLRDTGGSVLVVSNFTLFGDCRKGRRPSFTEAASGAQAETLYRAFGEAIAAFGVPVQYGVFGAEMQVRLVNDGPITLLLDSRRVF